MRSGKPKILVSSTAVDLREHRDRLLLTLLRLRLDGNGMEYFGAQPNTPVDVCMREVDQADLVVLVLAHRYGWIPSVAQGGDGKRSITRMEFDRARAAGKPVLVFVVDDSAPWIAPREQDKLLDADSDEAALAVFRSVQWLRDFKADAGLLVRDTFSTPADLADKAGSAVARWLFEWHASAPEQPSHSADAELQRLMSKVAGSLNSGNELVALAYLDDAAEKFSPAYVPTILDRRLEIAESCLSLHDTKLHAAAAAVRGSSGTQQALAVLVLGKMASLRAGDLAKSGKLDEAWQSALEARAYLEEATRQDEINPDAWGSLGGNLKRMALWAKTRAPSQVVALEDAMLEAYRGGWQRVADAYPLLNFIEQRARLAAQRDGATVARVLIEPQEHALRDALCAALRTREAQRSAGLMPPWAAFDVARARHYLRPNVPGFLEDLEVAVEDARRAARVAKDRYMIDTTAASLRCLLDANVKLEGLREGIELLEQAVVDETWYLERPRRATHYLEQELVQLRAAMVELAEQGLLLAARQLDEVACFRSAAELRWSREDEERFQAEIAQWREDLQPAELKIIRALWKVFGGKVLQSLTPGLPVDWDQALKLVRKLISG